MSIFIKLKTVNIIYVRLLTGWIQFINILTFKAEKAGRRVVKVALSGNLSALLNLLSSSSKRVIQSIVFLKVRRKLLEEAIANSLSLSEIRQKIKEREGSVRQPSLPKTQSPEETPSLKERVDETFRRFKKAKVWDNPKKKARIEKLLSQLEALMTD